MTSDRAAPCPPGPPQRSALAAIRGELRPGIAIVAATLAVELGVFALALAGGLNVRQAAVGLLMAACLWTALAAPVLAASGRGPLRTLLRAGLVADATFLSLAAMWLYWNFASPAPGAMSLLSVLEAYCTYASLAVFAAGVVSCAHRSAARYALAAGVAAMVTLALASPFWSGGLIAATSGATRLTVAALAVWLDPFYSITSAMIDSLHYVIHQEAVMYQVTLIGDYAAAPNCPPLTATMIYLPLGAVLSIFGASRRRSTP